MQMGPIHWHIVEELLLSLDKRCYPPYVDSVCYEYHLLNCIEHVWSYQSLLFFPAFNPIGHLNLIYNNMV